MRLTEGRLAVEREARRGEASQVAITRELLPLIHNWIAERGAVIASVIDYHVAEGTEHSDEMRLACLAFLVDFEEWHDARPALWLGNPVYCGHRDIGERAMDEQLGASRRRRYHEHRPRCLQMATAERL